MQKVFFPFITWSNEEGACQDFEMSYDYDYDVKKDIQNQSLNNPPETSVVLGLIVK